MKVFLVALSLLFASPALAWGPVHAPVPATEPPPFSPTIAPPTEAVPDFMNFMKLLSDDDEKKPEPEKISCTSHPCIPSFRFSDGVDEDAATKLNDFLLAAKIALADGVMIEINTPGGSMDDGHEMSRAIESAPFPVTCVVDGKAASMGMYLLASCGTRVMTKRSTLMVHQVAVVANGFKLTEISTGNISAVLRTTSRAYVEWVTHRMNITPAEVLARIGQGREWWMDWEEAYKVGAVDKIIGQTPDQFLQELRKPTVPTVVIPPPSQSLF